MRPSKDEMMLKIAEVLSTRSTCARRHVGCVLTNQFGHILSTGYNGVARGLPHCNEDHPCAGSEAMSGSDLERCEAIHAEQNALLQCPDVEKIQTCFVTTSPCVTCTKLLLNTGCKRIVFIEPYAHDSEASKLWLRAGREWIDVVDKNTQQELSAQESNSAAMTKDHNAGKHEHRPAFGCPKCIMKAHSRG